MNNEGTKRYIYFKFASLILAANIPPSLIRIALIWQKNIAFGSADLHGFLSDITISIFIAALLIFIASFRRTPSIIFLLLWSLANYGIYEHILTLDALPAIENAGYLFDTTFLFGSALTVSNPILFFIIIIIPQAITYLVHLEITGKNIIKAYVVPIILTSIILVLWRADYEKLLWRQVHFIPHNILSTFKGTTNLASSSTEAQRRKIGANLSGRPIIENDGRARNVLLVILEGISGAYFDVVAKRYGVNSRLKMERLNKIIKNNIFFTDFVAHQRQTNRGEYTILCGDYPKLTSGVARMSEYALQGNEITCLPGILSNEGYETVYLQSAPLGFMMKDKFMQQIGFEKICGDTCFDKAFKRGSWGVDDRAFFDKSIETIQELQENEKPWFLTLLTVGTHDPYIVPSDFKSVYKSGTFENAVSYLDKAVERFFKELNEKKLLEDTMVIITSDESVGLMAEANDLKRILSQNWGVLAIILPKNKKMRIDENFQQIDIAASTLDYLGLKNKARLFSGRSFFRSYDNPRKIFFGNALKRISGTYVPSSDQTGVSSSELYLCRENLKTCKKYKTKGDSLFNTEILSAKEITEADTIIEEMTALSRPLRKEKRRRKMELMAKQDIRLIDGYEQIIMGGQNIPIPAESLIEVELEMELIDADSKNSTGNTALTVNAFGDEVVNAKGEKQKTIADIMTLPPISVGDSFTLTNTYITKKELKKFEFILLSKKINGINVNLRVKKVVLNIKELTTEHNGRFRKSRVLNINGKDYKGRELITETIERYKKIVILEPLNLVALEYLGVSYAIGGMIDKTIESFKRALAIEPKSAQLHNLLADIYSAKGQKELSKLHRIRANELRDQ